MVVSFLFRSFSLHRFVVRVELVLDDVVDGLISRESAMRDFGVAITEDLVLDQSATAVLRDSRSS